MAISWNVWASAGRLLRVDEARVDGRGQDLEGADRRHLRRLVDQADPDRVGADRAGVDRGVRARAEQRVQAGDDAPGRIAERVDAGRVLDLVEAEHVGVDPGERRSSLSRWRVNSVGWSASAPRQSRFACRPHVPGRMSLAVVSSVRKKLSVFCAATRSVPPTGAGAAGRGLTRRVRRRAGRLDAVEAEVEPEHADGVLHRVAAAEAVGQRERGAVRMAQELRVLGALVVVERDPAQRFAGARAWPRRARLLDRGAA